MTNSMVVSIGYLRCLSIRRCPTSLRLDPNYRQTEGDVARRAADLCPFSSSTLRFCEVVYESFERLNARIRQAEHPVVVIRHDIHAPVFCVTHRLEDRPI